MSDLDWKARGNCLGLPVALFFPRRGEDTRPAKAVCASCPVREQCLDFALEHWDRFGIWGGLSERERRELRRSRERPRSPEHGTRNGCMKHYARGETPCEACRAAQAAYQRRIRGGSPIARGPRRKVSA